MSSINWKTTHIRMKMLKEKDKVKISEEIYTDAGHKLTNQ
jgi:hypothetical protein